MIRQSLIIATLAILPVVVMPATASAHVLKTDGAIGAILHIQPDDNPTAGKPVSYTLSFNNGAGGFRLSDCNCAVTVLKNGKMIGTKSLAAASGSLSTNTYTFPQAGVYTLRVSGTPKGDGGFQPFTFSYDVRVGGGPAAMQPMPMLLWVGMAMAVGLVLLAAYATDYDIERPRKEKS